MVFEDEITIEVENNYEKLHNLLKEEGFEIKEKYSIEDYYFTNQEIKNNYLDILKGYILVRNIIEETKTTKMIVYKYKNFDNDGNIIKQGKTKCLVDSIDSACQLLSNMGYNEFIKIYDKSVVYSNGLDELVVQEVNDKHLYIEVESICHYIDKKYDSIDEMKSIFSKYKIEPLYEDYFVKKALIEMKEKYK